MNLVIRNYWLEPGNYARRESYDARISMWHVLIVVLATLGIRRQFWDGKSLGTRIVTCFVNFFSTLEQRNSIVTLLNTRNIYFNFITRLPCVIKMLKLISRWQEFRGSSSQKSTNLKSSKPTFSFEFSRTNLRSTRRKETEATFPEFLSLRPWYSNWF